MMSEDVPPLAGTEPVELSGRRHRPGTPWFHELADPLSEVNGSAVVWLPVPGEFPRPLLLPGPRRGE
jgi:hypothetical protein